MSVQKKLWKITSNDVQISKLKQCNPLINQLLFNRKITELSDREKFLTGSLFDLYDPYELLDMDKAVSRIMTAINQKQKILIYGDYDVDGITSTVVLLTVIEELGGHVEYYIPDRHREGYGLNINALKWAAQSEFQLIITVDCGISAFTEAETASELDLDLVITDHHELEGAVPNAVAVINPKRHEDSYPFKQLAGVGVSFKLAQALWRLSEKHEQFINDLLCLVALGTVADVVPLIDENRIFVKYGLEQMNKHVANPGLKKLLEIANYKGTTISSYELAFVLAPRINAVGRLDHACWAVKLLLEKDEKVLTELAEKLNETNRIRQKLENDIWEEAERQLIMHHQDKVLVAASSNWNPGVIGIVASRLMEKYYKPVILIALEGDIGRGSGRSIGEFNLYQALVKCQDLIIRFGGHPAAAGLSIETDRIEEFRIRINQFAEQVLGSALILPHLNIDLELSSKDISCELIEEIEGLAPFGCGNPNPLFLLRNIPVQNLMQMGKEKNHLKIFLQAGNSVLEGVFFKRGDLAELIKTGDRISVVFRPSINDWKGKKTVQLLIEDLEIHKYVSPFPALNSILRENISAIKTYEANQGRWSVFIKEMQKKLLEAINRQGKPVLLSIRSKFYGFMLLKKTLADLSYWGIKIAISCPLLGGDDYVCLKDATQLGYDIIVISWEKIQDKESYQFAVQKTGEVLELDYPDNFIVPSPSENGIASLDKLAEEPKKIILIINSSWTREENQWISTKLQVPIWNCTLPHLSLIEKMTLLQEFFYSPQGVLVIDGFAAADLDYSEYKGNVVILDPCLSTLESFLIGTIKDKINGKLYKIKGSLLKQRLKKCLQERTPDAVDLRELYKCLYLVLKRTYAWNNREEFAQTLSEAMENKFSTFSVLLGLAVFIELGLVESERVNGKYTFKLKHESGNKVSLDDSSVYLGIQREKREYENLLIG